jgi:hypothetical protein
MEAASTALGAEQTVMASQAGGAPGIAKIQPEQPLDAPTEDGQLTRESELPQTASAKEQSTRQCSPEDQLRGV